MFMNGIKNKIDLSNNVEIKDKSDMKLQIIIDFI